MHAVITRTAEKRLSFYTTEDVQKRRNLILIVSVVRSKHANLRNDRLKKEDLRMHSKRRKRVHTTRILPSCSLA